MEAVDPVGLTAALVRCPSLTPREAGTFDILEAALRPLGFALERLRFASPGAEPVDNLYAKLGSGQPHLAFSGHVDVVPPGRAELWSVDPFGAEIRDGRLYGRGAADMKSGIAAFVAATARFLEARPAFDGAISLLVTADEEGPSTDGTARLLAWAEQRGERFDGCIVGEPTCPERLGEMMKIGRRGSLVGRLEVEGRQGHTAYPQRAENAAHRLVGMLGALLAEPIDEGSAGFQPSDLQITSIDIGNPATNVIPGIARAVFNVRYNDRQTQASLDRWLRQRLDAAGGCYRLETMSSGDAFRTPPGPLSEALVEAVEAVTGLRPEPSTSGGTSDARFIRHHCPVVEFGLVGATMHQADEHVRLEDIEQLTRIYQLFLERYFGAS
jgi:succinyl-diaminopimelate desuccinylase